jgi:Right handed beta helix region
MRILLAGLVVAITLVANTASALDVTICNQTVPHGEVGVLQDDLFCDANSGPNVTLGSGSTLKLNGHRIDGGYIGVWAQIGGVVRILGPGEITGADGDQFGAAIVASGKVLIDTVHLHGNRRGIIMGDRSPVRLANVIITGNTLEGITTDAANSAPDGAKISGRDVTIASNGGDALVAFGSITLRHSFINENGGAGIRSNGKKFTLQDVAVTNNAGAGIVSTSSKRGQLKRSAATGNGAEGDIAAPVAPKLVSSTCDHSVDTDSGGTLGICSGD